MWPEIKEYESEHQAIIDSTLERRKEQLMILQIHVFF